MDKQILIFLITIFIATAGMARGFDLNINNLIAPPTMIKYQGSAHAVFDMGGMKYLFKVTQEARLFPQCNAIQKKGKEIMVVGHSPDGYAYFVDKNPVAFKTNHNPSWTDIVKRTHE